MSLPRAAAFDLLQRADQAGRLAHAYLISASEPDESRQLAAHLAGMVTGSSPTLDHPDIHLAEPESKSRRIRIEQTRGLERELQMRSLLGGRKVAILFDADRMTIEAANAFLKTLEEPPAHSLIILTSTAPETLPETILSRCIAVPLAPTACARALTPAQTALLQMLRTFSERDTADLADVFKLVQLFVHQLRDARERLAGETAAALKAEETQYKQTTDCAAWLEEREDFYKALTESRYIQERFALVDTLMQWWADVLRQRSGFAELDLPGSAADTARMAQRLTTARTLRRIAHLEELRENLNRTGVQELLAIEVAFLNAFSS